MTTRATRYEGSRRDLGLVRYRLVAGADRWFAAVRLPDMAERVTGGILIFCGGRRTLAAPVGLGFYKCARCGAIIRGVE